MSKGPLIWNFSPAQERKAVAAFVGFVILSLIGAGALLFAAALGFVKLVQAVFS